MAENSRIASITLDISPARLLNDAARAIALPLDAEAWQPHLPSIRTSPVQLSVGVGETTMFRLSKLTDYAVVVLVRLARDGASNAPCATVQTSPGISGATGIPEPTVAKVLKAMTAKGLVTSLRGAHGGYRLTRRLADIRIADVIEAIDGPIALTACVDGGDCESQCLCPMRGRWDPVNAAIRGALGRITLEDMEKACLPPMFAAVPAAAHAHADMLPAPSV